MAFTEVSWANGDYLTETKLDQMVATDLHVREESNYYHLVNEAANGETTTAATGTITLAFTLDGASLGTGATGAGESVEEIDISAQSAGIHELGVTVSGSTGGSYARKYRFYKTPDMGYLTIFAELASRADAGDNYYIVKNLTVIGHRQTKSWTT